MKSNKPPVLSRRLFSKRLAVAREFDRGTDVYVKGLTAAELREALNL